MHIRNLRIGEEEKINKIVRSEKAEEKPYFRPENTYVIDDDIKGFYYFMFEHGFPSLRHFYIKKKYRNAGYARTFIRHYIDMIKSKGYAKTIMHASEEYIDTLIRYYFKKTPYAKVGATYYYLIEV